MYAVEHQVIRRMILSLIVNRAHCYTCSTPDEWMGIYSKYSASKNLPSGKLWSDGIVKYHLNSSLSKTDKNEVFAAFEEYHGKTCVRFQPKSVDDKDYVSIERDDKKCGEANVCKIGGYQYAKFGANCRERDSMIHELGHTLCLGHEHQRHDRDEYLFYNETCNFHPNNEKQFRNKARGIYDYASQMHYQCGDCDGGWPIQNVGKCGPSVTSGLSVLDVDLVNSLYNCQGCYRHRWISIEYLTEADEAKMYNFEYLSQTGIPLYPCRVAINGTLLIGNFHKIRRSCTAGYQKKVYNFMKKFEVLTIPGGLRLNDSEYMLVHVHEEKTKMDLNSIFKDAVVAGHLPWANGSGYGNGYVAYGVVKGFKKWCSEVWTENFDSDPWGGFELDTVEKDEDAPKDSVSLGSAWRFQDDYSAFFPLCEKQIQFHTYNVLVCIGRDAQETDQNAYEGRSKKQHISKGANASGHELFYGSKNSAKKVAAFQPKEPSLSVIETSNSGTSEANLLMYGHLRAIIDANATFTICFIISVILFFVLLIPTVWIIVNKITNRQNYQGVPVHVIHTANCK